MDTEERVPAQHFHIPVLEVEGFMCSHGSRVGGKLLVRSIWDCQVDGFVIGNVAGGEVGECCDADGRRMGDRGCTNCVYLSDDGRVGWRGLKDLRFTIVVDEPEGRGNRDCTSILPVRAGQFRLPGLEDRWGRETFPPTLP